MNNVTGFTHTPKIKQEAAMWLLLMDEQSPLSDENVEALRAWVNTSEVHRQVITQMSKTWNDMDLLAAMMAPPEKVRAQSKFRIWIVSPISKVCRFIGNLLSPMQVLFNSRLSASASLFVVAIVCSGLYFSVLDEGKVDGLSNVYITKVGEHAKHQLSDGSVLWLNSNSTVEVMYSNQFRRVNLIAGEAHFQVEKDASRPFEVYAQDRLVRAVGTAFSVYRLDDHIEVMVSEGRVELAIVDRTLLIQPDYVAGSTPNAKHAIKQKVVANIANNKPAEISESLGELEAGQRISIPTTQNITIKTAQNEVTKIETSDIVRKLSWLDGKLVFAGESLEEVVTEISRHTSMQIDVPDPALRKMRIGGHFQAGETDTLFYVLESGFGIQVNRLDDNHVELHAKE